MSIPLCTDLIAAVDRLIAFAEKHDRQWIEKRAFAEAESLDARICLLCGKLSFPGPQHRQPEGYLQHALPFTGMLWQEKSRGHMYVYNWGTGKLFGPRDEDDNPTQIMPLPVERWWGTMRHPRALAEAHGEAEGDSESSKPSQRRGRKPDTDPKADNLIADAWGIGRYRTYAECANALRITKKQVKAALDRHRHRSSGKRRKRAEAPE